MDGLVHAGIPDLLLQPRCQACTERMPVEQHFMTFPSPFFVLLVEWPFCCMMADAFLLIEHDNSLILNCNLHNVAHRACICNLRRVVVHEHGVAGRQVSLRQQLRNLGGFHNRPFLSYLDVVSQKNGPSWPTCTGFAMQSQPLHQNFTVMVDPGRPVSVSH